MIKILIADDHAVVRRGVKEILGEMSIPLEVDEVETAQSAIKAVMNQQYDILLLDISFPDGNGVDVLKQVQQINPNTRVLILSMYPEEQYARRVLKAGAYGYLTKDSAPIELVSAIQKVIAGGRYVTLSLAEKLADDLVSPAKSIPHEALSNREFQVLKAIAKGKSSSQIASELALSPKTISTYRSRILEKLNLKTTAELIRYALENNL